MSNARPRIPVSALLLSAVLLAFTSASAAVPEMMTIPVIPGPNAGAEETLQFEAERSNVVATNGGYQITGDVFLVTPIARIRLAGSNLFFSFAEGTDRVERLRGQAYVPSPYASDAVEIKKPAMAEVGMDFGRNLDLDSPLQDDRAYLFFNFDSGLEMSVATNSETDSKPLTLSIPSGAKAQMVLDPLDPFFFISGGVMTPEGSGDDSNKEGDANNDSQENTKQDSRKTDDEDQQSGNLGHGTSANGLIPFVPETTYGIEDVVRTFYGNKVQVGEFPVGTLPLTVTGTFVSEVSYVTDADEAFDPLNLEFGPVFKQGANGTLNVTYSFLKAGKFGKIAELGFEAGTATVALEIVDDIQHAYFSGVIEPDLVWIPDFVPWQPEGYLKAYGYVSSDFAKSRLGIEGRYAIDASNFGEMTGLEISDVIVVDGVMRVNQDGFLVRGATNANLGPVNFQAGAQVEVFIPFDGEPGYLEITGMIRVDRLLTNGTIRLSTEGAYLNGMVVNDEVEIRAALEIARRDNISYMQGELSVPAQFNATLHQAVLDEAKQAQDEAAAALADLEGATKDLEFEVSLRGVRRLVPGICDGAIVEIDSRIVSTINEKWPKAFGTYLPGRSSAISYARSKAKPSVDRLQRLKTFVRQGDSASVRAALKSAMNDLLRNSHLNISVSKIGTIYNREILSSTQKAYLRKGIAAIDSIPEKSNLKISAQRIWDNIPKREILAETAEAIQNGVGAAPTIESLRFYHVMRSGEWQLTAVVSHGGEATTIEFNFDPEDPTAIGRHIAQSFVPLL